MEIVRDVAIEIRESVRDYTRHHRLKLLGISVFDYNQDVETYSDWINYTCGEDGIDYELWKLPTKGINDLETASMLKKKIEIANQLPGIHGVLIYYPIMTNPIVVVDEDDAEGKLLSRTRTSRAPGVQIKTKDDEFRNMVRYDRDVEGLCSTYHSRRIFRNTNLYVDRIGHILNGSEGVIFPCTALAVVRILQRCIHGTHAYVPQRKIFQGVVVTIINRSEILGRPLASLLANDGATVYSIDIDSVLCYKPNTGRVQNCTYRENFTTESCIKKSSVIVTAVPSSTFNIPAEWISPGSTVVNVSSDPNVSEDELMKVQGVTYVPQVGKVTIAVLEQNLMLLHQRQRHKS